VILKLIDKESLDTILELRAPIFCFLEITNKCNNNCFGCGNVFQYKRSEKDLTYKQWKTIINKIAPHINHVRVTGGEPSLRKDLFLILDELEKRKIEFSIFTNARWNNPNIFLNRLKKYKLFTGLLISLHGATAFSHEKWSRIKGSFKETIKNIRLAISCDIMVDTNAVISPYNYDEVEKLTKLAFNLGAKTMVFNRFYGKNESGDFQKLETETSEKQLITAIKTIEKLKNKYNGRVIHGNCTPQCFYPTSSGGCLTGITYCTIDPFGNVRPCNHSPWKIGNILKKSLPSLWQSSKMREWRNYFPAECKKCSLFLKCHGGCKALMAEFGMQKDPLMKKTIPAKKSKPAAEKEDTITIHKNIIPVKNIQKIRKEKMGYTLINKSQAIVITKEGYGIIKYCNNKNTLLKIQKKFGDNALNFIYSLYQKGFILFSMPAAAGQEPAHRQ